MNIELVKVVKNEFDADYADFENQGGSVFIKVNGKTVEVIIQPCGELDFDGDVLEEEEMDAVLDFFYSNEEVNNSFPNDEFE